MRQTYIFIAMLLAIGGLAQGVSGCGNDSDPSTALFNLEASGSVMAVLKEKGLQADMENAQRTTVMGRVVTAVPLILTEPQGVRLDRKDSMRAEPPSHFLAYLAYLDDKQLGRVFVLLEISRGQEPEMRSSMRLTIPGREFVFDGEPSWFYQWEITQDGSSLQVRDGPYDIPYICNPINLLFILIFAGIIVEPWHPFLLLLGILVYAIADVLGCSISPL